jgi:acyl-CoA dehydrogenase
MKDATQAKLATTELATRVASFMNDVIYPAESVYYAQQADGDRWINPPIMESLKSQARDAGLWNLFIPPGVHEGLPAGVDGGVGLSNVEYAPLCELMGRSPIGPEAFNCAAPDTGNMETLLKFGTPAQKKQWLEPLLAGNIRSAFAMTEPAVASSDATNIQADVRRDGNDYVINARKWWTSGSGDPRCEIMILMGKTDTEQDRYRQQSMVLVPRQTPGVNVLRHLNVFGYDDAPKGHMEVEFRDVRVPCENVLLGEGRGFEIAQARLGPGRIHHCMRAIGVAERSLEAMCARVKDRVAFGKPLAEQGVIMDSIARSRMEIEQARALVMHTAALVDVHGGRGARPHIAMIKVAVPNMTLAVIDRAIQAHGGAGICDDFGLAKAWTQARTLRIADGPDDVHLRTVARAELGKPAQAWYGRTASV